MTIVIFEKAHFCGPYPSLAAAQEAVNQLIAKYDGFYSEADFTFAPIGELG